ncbi:hypothetical protein PHYPO_G00066930 [Pangasianodon hypophthalmus]|uniref:Uncharacterized protein n=1 Tax=Pangasianodon hypophthalmus TaxID=310915 RepID=A0A5N5LTA4_PANHP|nr:hypothetical protein PHYPO_G00066930 [Pangasianodon hypophthalmus]
MRRSRVGLRGPCARGVRAVVRAVVRMRKSHVAQTESERERERKGAESQSSESRSFTRLAAKISRRWI